jgi:hypothetical protein
LASLRNFVFREGRGGGYLICLPFVGAGSLRTCAVILHQKPVSPLLWSQDFTKPRSMKKASKDSPEGLKRRLDGLLKLPEHQICADCPTKQPRWASSKLGVFICIDCSGIHRNLGTHISFVRSVNLDAWTVQQVEFMEQWGNARAKAYFEAEIPASYNRPHEGAGVRDVQRWIRDKCVFGLCQRWWVGVFFLSMRPLFHRFSFFFLGRYEFKRFVPQDGSVPGKGEAASRPAAAPTPVAQAPKPTPVRVCLFI